MEQQNHDSLSAEENVWNVTNAENPSSDVAPNIIFAAAKTEISSGFLPHPEYMKAYNDVIPNGAERIMRFTEREQEYSFEERREVRQTNSKLALGQLKYLNRGQIMGFSIALIMVAIATVFVFTGHESIAYFVFSVGAASLVGLFLNSKSEKRKSQSDADTHT